MIYALLALALLILHNEHMHRPPPAPDLSAHLRDLMRLAERGTPRSHAAAQLLKAEINWGQSRLPTNAARDGRAYRLAAGFPSTLSPRKN